MKDHLHSSPKKWHGPTPPAELTENASSLQLISQGAEARIWMVTLHNPPVSAAEDTDGGSRKRTIHVGSGINVPQLVGFSQVPSPLSAIANATGKTCKKSLKFICKERFPKKYRHPHLDTSLTKSRTKGEARSLIRCQRADIPCPNVLAIAHWPSGIKSAGDNENVSSPASKSSSCIFIECVEGCTVREYFEGRSAKPPKAEAEYGGAGAEPVTKRARCEESASKPDERVTTVIDSLTLRVAHTIGLLVARMHAAGIIHGDLTTSNIMMKNPQHLATDGSKGSESDTLTWRPQLVLIDFGLATSTASTNKTTNGGACSNKKAKPHKQQHNSEEKAVDLYVLERAFLSTHPESELLVEEVLKGYSSCGGDGIDHDTARVVLNRLDQVRMRGRKRECFG
ncbi:hypothetical protein ACHAWF_001758 [Thalassiosira exigua]